MDKNEKQRLYRSRNGNACTKKYEKTHRGFLMRLYRNMQSRITGVQKSKYHLYEGKELLAKNDFYDWAIKNHKFISLFNEFENNNYNRKLSPSVDRIDSSKGYLIENMEWVTHSENSKRGVLSKIRIYNLKSHK